MTRFLLTIVLFIGSTLPISAQSGLIINKIFNGRYSTDPRVTETVISGNSNYLKKNKLSVFASFRGPSAVYAAEIQKCVLSDGASAVGKDVRYKNGKLYFAYYMLKPEKSGDKTINRYIYYLNSAATGGDNVLVVYMEGAASEQTVSELIRNMAKKTK